MLNFSWLKFILLSVYLFSAYPLKLNDLQSDTRVSRDQAGIPHTYAHNDHDAYFMMEYIEATDLFFQIECTRRYYEGKLAELLGDNSLDSDLQIRKSWITMGGRVRFCERLAGRFRRSTHSVSVPYRLSEQRQNLKADIKELQEQNRLLAHDKWLLAQEKAQLIGQLKQLSAI